MKKLILSAIIFSLFLCGCNNSSSFNTKVKVENKLNRNIICILGYGYPDLKLAFINKEIIKSDKGRFVISPGQKRIIDTLGLCQKSVWDKYLSHNVLMFLVFDADKFSSAISSEDALIERQYFTYIQLMKTNGVITVD